MIDSFKCIKNLGQFKAVHDVKLAKNTLIFGENGRGKTMLSEALRSLATGQPELVLGRARLGAGDPVVVLELSDGGGVLSWPKGNPKVDKPDIAVFNDGFVDANVCSGLEVTSDQRKSLHPYIVGAEGVTLARKYDAEVRRAKDARAEMDQLETDIKQQIEGEFDVGRFCRCEPSDDVDQAIARNKDSIDAALHKSSISRLALLTEHVMPEINLSETRDLLLKSASHLNQEAADRVQDHLKALWVNSEKWVGEGVENSNKRACPYCGQDLSASQIVSDYEHYFNDAYSALKDEVNEAMGRFRRVSNEGRRNELTRLHDENEGLLREWAEYGLDAERQGKLDLDSLKQDWINLDSHVEEALERKASSPLQDVGLAQNTDALWSRCRSQVDAENGRIRKINEKIKCLKASSKSGDLAALRAEELRLKRQKMRSEPRIIELCERYLEAKARRDEANQARDAAKDLLDKHEESTFRSFRDAVSKYLRRFGAGFALEEIRGDRPGGVVTTSYEIDIRGHRVPVKSARPPAGKFSFGNTLSAGDRTTLALAYFMASLENQGGLGKRVVVFDDPCSSLDAGRRDKTIETIVQLEPCVQQLIVMSHDSLFMCELNDALKRRGKLATLIINRYGKRGQESRIGPWEIDDACMSEIEVHASRLEQFANTGEGDVMEVVKHIRPFLEAYLHLAFKTEYDSHDGLGDFVNLCRTRLDRGEPLLDKRGIDMLDSLRDFSNKHMHHAPPPLTHDELAVRVDETLRFCRGDRSDTPSS